MVTRGLDPVDDRPAEIRSPLGEQVDSIGDRFLLVDGEASPPLDELIGDLDLSHQPSMSQYSS